ncbi:putative endo-beta-1 [Hyphodiscus hymeniophilus]|uniref:AA9 family lytic polysaccharide monooxygenase n=1 Tax=Hyphodiscus hymeniophilus TaxID=353542 RepID=A0A9P6VEK8_9HELO|nr:putative endo-beta-1 [Hyphodiscus hymeniophilus]
MKSFTAFAVGLVLAGHASAHYIFERFTYGGTEYPVYQYIRPNTNDNSPITDLTSDDLRCNQGGESGAGTEIITVQAGASFSFTTDVAVYHDGPLSIYMAKAPTTADAFDGSGQVWFKILDIGPTFDASGTATWTLLQTYTYTIPPALPNGDYLLRIQQLGIHNPYPAGIPQFYLECAQITVVGGGSGTPGPLVSIPGFIDGTEPGYTVNIYTNFHNYTVPGPAVWSGQSAVGGSTPTTPVSKPTTPATTSTKVAPTSTTVKATSMTTPISKTSTKTTSSQASATGAVVAKYGQCGGSGWTGGTVCVAGSTCTVSNTYYSQCL